MIFKNPVSYEFKIMVPRLDWTLPELEKPRKSATVKQSGHTTKLNRVVPLILDFLEFELRKYFKISD